MLVLIIFLTGRVFQINTEIIIILCKLLKPVHVDDLYSEGGGPVLGASTTTFIFLLTAGFFDSGSVLLTNWYRPTKRPSPLIQESNPSCLLTCWQSKSSASSGATPSSHTASLFSMSFWVGVGLLANGGRGGEAPPRSEVLDVRFATIDRLKRGAKLRDAMLVEMMVVNSKCMLLKVGVIAP